jgi:toxin ParE1/3/4
MTRPYVLTKGAAADLRDIARYTIETWGLDQCQAYIRQIEDAACQVAGRKGTFRDMSSLYPGLLMRSVGKHYIFCLPRPNKKALILAVLHDRMDIVARLKKRLA